MISTLKRRTRQRSHYSLDALESRVLLSASYELSTIAAFDGMGGLAQQGLVADANGNLYGAVLGTNFTTDPGAIVEIAAGTHQLSTVASFHGSDGAQPNSGLVIDGSGNIFGTTTRGGAYGGGTVFEIAAGENAVTTLVSFNNIDGDGPEAGLIADAAGNLYGTTSAGGISAGGGGGHGTVFEVDATTHALTTLATFDGSDGDSPISRLLRDASGNLVGTTRLGGSQGYGTVFEVVAGTDELRTLVNFNITNGQIPESGLVADASGNLYGTTFNGGDANYREFSGNEVTNLTYYGVGTVFKLSAGTYQLTRLVSFNFDNGSFPGQLVIDSSGNLFGTTGGDASPTGPNNFGTIFEIAAGTNTVTTLATFNGSNGQYPGALSIGGDGRLFGTTSERINFDGSVGGGTVFNLVPRTPLVVTTPDAGSQPLVKVFDPTTGNLNFSFLAYNQDFAGAVHVAVGDFNGDGVPDIVTAPGMGGQPLINVFDGKTGTMISSFYAYDRAYMGGVEIATADFNGDGQTKIITSTDASGMPLVNVFDLNGTLIHNFYAYDPAYTGGVHVSEGDMYGNGQSEILTSTPVGTPPLIQAFNESGTLTGTVWGDDPTYTGGLQIAVGNFTANGPANIATLREQTPTAQVKTVNLVTQSQLSTVTLAVPSLSVPLRLAATDVDADGVAELITVPTAGGTPEVEIFSSQTGSLIRQWAAYSSSQTTGLFVAAG